MTADGPGGRPAGGTGERVRILFVCTHNSARSQMAEALLVRAAGGAVDVSSAGVEPGAVHPLTRQALAETGIDPSGLRAKSVDTFVGQAWDYVVTVCDSARERCPNFPGGGRRLHWSLDDPSAATGTEEERLAVFRRVRDEIDERVRSLAVGLLGAPWVGAR